jgi:hypothetical protein
MLGMQIIRMNGKHANFEVEQKDLGFVQHVWELFNSARVFGPSV